jgi:hypothetical protein
MSFVYYRKHELIKLCELAQELDLEKITSTNDYELSQVNRRPITENGVTQVVCEIGQVPIWSPDLKLLPVILNSVTYYLAKKCDWNDDMTASNCTKKTTEMLYSLPTLPSIRFTQHQSLESLMGLSIFTVNDVVFTFTSGIANQTGSNDACSLRQIT